MDGLTRFYLPFWVDQLSLTFLHRGSTPSVVSTENKEQSPWLSVAHFHLFTPWTSRAAATMEGMVEVAHLTRPLLGGRLLVGSPGASPLLAFLISPPVRFCQAGIFCDRGNRFHFLYRRTTAPRNAPSPHHFVADLTPPDLPQVVAEDS